MGQETQNANNDSVDGTRINFHPHLHYLVTEGGVDEAGLFHKVPRIDDARLAELFGREVLADLVRKELLSPEWADRLLSWRHTGFNVHSRVRAKTKREAERVGKYMIRPPQADRPPPPHQLYQKVLMAAEPSGKYFS